MLSFVASWLAVSKPKTEGLSIFIFGPILLELNDELYFGIIGPNSFSDIGLYFQQVKLDEGFQNANNGILSKRIKNKFFTGSVAWVLWTKDYRFYI